MATHPDAAELRAYLANTQSAEADERIARHLAESCPECEAVIDTLERAAGGGFADPPPALVSRIGRIGREPLPIGPPPLVPGYRIVRALGRGGMAVVYLATDAAGRETALKVIPNAAFAAPEAVARFLREGNLFKTVSDQAQALPAESRPALAEVYGVGQTSEVLFIEMEYAAGGTLRDRLPEFAADPASAARLVAEAADAVGWLNTRTPPVFHRDCKPSNLLLQPPAGADGSAPVAAQHVRLADLGLARRDDDLSFTRTGDTVGTPHYLAPELLAQGAKPTPATEVYALGATLYELLAGEPPFAAETMSDVLPAILKEHPQRPTRPGFLVPPDLQAVCLKCLERSPRRRYPSAAALATDLRQFLAGRPIAATLPSAPRRVVRWCGKNPVAATALVALSLLVAFVAAAWQSTADQARAATATADAATARADLGEAERHRSQERVDRLGEKYALLLKLGLAAGDNRQVLDLFAQAKKEGLVLSPEMRLAYIQGLAGVQKPEEVRDEVNAVPLDDLQPAGRGQYELWRATTRFGVADEEATAYLQAALTRPLPPADQAFAKGLNATTTPEAVKQYQEAIRRDLLHQPARSNACILLLTLGRIDEALLLAEESARLLPRHPDFPVILALGHAIRGRRKLALESLATLKTLLPAPQFQTLEAAVPVLADAGTLFRRQIGYPPIEGADEVQGIDLWALLPRIPPLGQGGAVNAGKARDIMGHLPPVQRANLGPYIDLLENGFRIDWPERFKIPGYLDKALSTHPEGLLSFLAVQRAIEEPTPAAETVPQMVDRYRRIAAAAERTAALPSIIPIQDVALDLAIMLYAVVAQPMGRVDLADPAAGRKAIELLHRRRAKWGDVPPVREYDMARVALTVGELPLARTYLDRFQKRDPDHREALRLRARLEYRSEAYRPALRAVNRFLTHDPKDAEMRAMWLSVWAHLLSDPWRIK